MHASRSESPIWYSVDPDSESEHQRYPLKFLEEAESGIEEFIKRNGLWWSQLAAEEHFHDNDGWEATWPLLFALYDGKTGPEVGRYMVSLSQEPVFNSSPCTVDADAV